MTMKVVVMMPLGDEKKRREAMQLAVRAPGVISAAIDQDKGHLTVTGENVDAVKVTKVLREGRTGKLAKLLSCGQPKRSVQIVAVGEVKEEKKEEEKKKEGDGKEAPNPPWHCWYGAQPPMFQLVEIPQPRGCLFG